MPERGGGRGDGEGRGMREKVEVPEEREDKDEEERTGMRQGRKGGRVREGVRLAGWLGGLRQVGLTHSISHSRSLILTGLPAGHAPRTACWEEDV